MDEILELQRQLAQVSKRTTLNKIAERNIVEILEKLAKDYGLKLIYSTDGKLFVTPDHLDKMIGETVQEAGRLSIIEIPKILNMSIENIEQRIESVIRKNQFYLVDRVLITREYFDKLCDEINEDLIKKSELYLSDLAIKYEFSTNFLYNTIKERLGTVISGIFTPDGTKILTEGYLNIIKSQWKGIIRSQWGPVNLSAISKKYSMEDEKTVSFLEELIRDNEIYGKIQGGMFFPQRFLDMQSDLVKKYFEKNGYIEYEIITNEFYIKKDKQFISNCQEGKFVFQETCAYALSEMTDLEERINNFINENGYCETYDIFPANFTDEDISQILFKEQSLEDSIMLEENVLLSKAFYEKCIVKLKSRIYKAATEGPSSDIGKSGDKAKGKKPAKKGLKQEKVIPDSDILKYLQEQNMIEYITDETTRDIFCKHLQPFIQKSYDSFKAEQTSTGATISVDLMNQITTKVNHLAFCIAMVNKSISTAITKAENFDENLIEKRAQEIGSIFIDQLVFLSQKKHGTTVKSSYLSEDQTAPKNEYDGLRQTMFLNTNACLKACEALPRDLSGMIKNINKILAEEKNLAMLAEYLDGNCLQLGISKLTIDKKSEKNYVYAQKFFIKDKLKTESDPKIKLALILSYMFAERNYFFFLESGVEGALDSIQMYWSLQETLNIGSNCSFMMELKEIKTFVGNPGDQDKESTKRVETLFAEIGKKMK